MNISSAVSHARYAERDLQSFILSQAASHQHAAALWRLPDSDLTHLLISTQHTALDRDEFLEELDAGFIVAPFDRSNQRIFLKADYLFTFQNGQLKNEDAPEAQAGLQWLSDQLSSFEKQTYRPPVAGGPLGTLEQDKEAFISMITNGIREIEKGVFEKIVPSRSRVVKLPPSFDTIDAFQKLSAAYRSALVSFVSIPGFGNWLGASPEILVCVQDKSIFKTVALAGTLPYQPGLDLKAVAWTQKEIEEQALVGRYVISCFKKVRLREYEEHGPRTVVAGNLVHLKSEYTVDMKATNFPQIGTVMLDLLHPTSAVCGMPLEPSLEFLKREEPNDRRFYAGYWGPVNIHNNIELYVNIRCMQIAGDRGILYAGAGVTIDSDPEKEWAETEMKFDTLLNVIL